MGLIEKLFQMVNDENTSLNPFETAEVNEKCDNFYEKYIDTTQEAKGDELSYMWDMWECFAEALMAERKQAFKVGYATALKLIIPGSIDSPLP